jgi:hypothetical protein
MPYVSCKYAPPPPIPVDPQIVVCTDEQGIEWSLNPDNTDDAQFKVFLDDGGEIEPYEPPPEPEPEPEVEPH